MGEFFAMGGYAAFVWPAWGLSALAIGGLIAFALGERRAARARLEELENETIQAGPV